MKKEILNDWWLLMNQYQKGFHLSRNDWMELTRLNHLIMEKSHEIHNENMLGIKENINN